VRGEKIFFVLFRPRCDWDLHVHQLFVINRLLTTFDAQRRL